MRVYDLRFRKKDLGFKAWYRERNLRFRAWGLGLKV